MKRYYYILSIVLTGLFLTQFMGCGQMGPLYLPQTTPDKLIAQG
ncbi:MAG: hypothetical protein LEGION0398_MBIBDBAK_00631 [Legionellaceae bacterium]